MKPKPVRPRQQALHDVDEALVYYMAEVPEAVALGFVDALEQAFAHIARHRLTALWA